MSKVVLDTCGWLACFADEPHADEYAAAADRREAVWPLPALAAAVHLSGWSLTWEKWTGWTAGVTRLRSWGPDSSVMPARET